MQTTRVVCTDFAEVLTLGNACFVFSLFIQCFLCSRLKVRVAGTAFRLLTSTISIASKVWLRRCRRTRVSASEFRIAELLSYECRRHDTPA